MFSTGADMGNAYTWYEGAKQNGDARPRRPSQRRRLSVDRKTFGFYHELMGYPKVDGGRGARATPSAAASSSR